MTPARRLLLFLTGINLLNYLDRYVMMAVLEPVGRELRLGDGQLGQLTLAFLVVYMLTAPLFGLLGDRYPRPRLVAFGIALWCLATAGAAFAHSFPMLLLSRALVGVGEAAYASLAPPMLADSFPEDQRPRAFTLFYLAIPVGSALGYAFGGLMTGLVSWRASFLVAGLPGLALAFWMLRQVDPVRGAHDILPDPAAGRPLTERLGLIFSNRVWLACTASYIAYTFAMGILSGWAPVLLQRRFGLGVAAAGMVFGGFAVVTGLGGTLLGGHLTDRWQHRWRNAGLWLSAGTLLAAVPVTAWGLVTRDLHAAYLAFFLGMFLLFVNTSPVNALTVGALPASARATGTALNVLFIHLLGDAASPWLTGLHSDHLRGLGWRPDAALGTAMLWALPAIALAGLVLVWARRPGPSGTAPAP